MKKIFSIVLGLSLMASVGFAAPSLVLIPNTFVAHTKAQAAQVNANFQHLQSVFNSDMPSGDIVGTTDAQVLTNKTLTSPTLTTPYITSLSLTGTPTAAGSTWDNLGTVTSSTFTYVNINGGKIDNAVIGSVTPANGTFNVTTAGTIIANNGAQVGSLTGLITGTTGTLGAVALGTANQKMFMNAGATAPEFATGISIGTSTRVMNAANGDISYTGIGFKPSVIEFFAAGFDTSNGNSGFNSQGFDDGTHHYCTFSTTDTSATYKSRTYTSSSIIMALGNNSGSVAGNIKSMDANGFTITWTKSNTPPTNTVTFIWIAYR